MKRLLSLTFAVSVFFTVSQGHAQDGDMQTLVDRLERMDRDIKALNLKVYRGVDAVAPGAASTGATQELSGPLGARLSVRINELESQLRDVTGQIEETAFRISQLNTRLDKLVADVDYRLTVLEGGNPVAGRPLTQQQTIPQGPADGSINVQPLSPETQQQLANRQPGVLGTLNQSDLNTPATQGTPAPTPAARPDVQPLNGVETAPAAQETQVAALSPKETYDNSLQMLMRGEYANAENAFKSFLENHKDDGLAGNARYWLGETYYVQGNFAQAAAFFLEGYQKSPRGAKAPDSLLKLGMSLIRMDKNTEACATFGKLRADFPKMPAHLSKTLERERASAQCG